MAASVKFDSTEIATTVYNPQFVKHESAPERELDTFKLSRDDGSILVASVYGTKTISLRGVLVGSSQSDLETKIDAFKELFSRPEKNLDIDWEGNTRRYVATCKAMDFDRDHFHIRFVPWTAEFLIVSGEGKATSSTTASFVTSSGNPITEQFTLAGSKAPKPIITIEGDAPSAFDAAVSGIEITNTDNGDKIAITQPGANFSVGKFFINCLTKKVTTDIGAAAQREVPFYGVFPRFKIGVNNISIQFGQIVNQQTTEANIADASGQFPFSATTRRGAQSFSVPYTDETFSAIALGLSKEGTPAGDLTVRIETSRSDGYASGTLVDANATATIAMASVTGTPAYVTVGFPGMFTLEAGQTYWIVCSQSGTLSGASCAEWNNTDQPYPRGKAATSTDSGTTYADSAGDFAFKLYFGGLAGSCDINFGVDYTKVYL